MAIAAYWLPLTKIEKCISAEEAVASLMIRRMQSYTITQLFTASEGYISGSPLYSGLLRFWVLGSAIPWENLASYLIL